MQTFGFLRQGENGQNHNVVRHDFRRNFVGGTQKKGCGDKGNGDDCPDDYENFAGMTALVDIVPSVELLRTGIETKDSHVNNAEGGNQVFVSINREEVYYHKNNEHHRPEICDGAQNFFAAKDGHCFTFYSFLALSSRLPSNLRVLPFGFVSSALPSLLLPNFPLSNNCFKNAELSSR